LVLGLNERIHLLRKKVTRLREGKGKGRMGKEEGTRNPNQKLFVFCEINLAITFFHSITSGVP